MECSLQREIFTLVKVSSLHVQLQTNYYIPSIIITGKTPRLCGVWRTSVHTPADYRGLERNSITADRNGLRADRLLGVIEENRESMVAGRGIPALLADTRPALIRRNVDPHCLRRRSALLATAARSACVIGPHCWQRWSALFAIYRSDVGPHC